MKQTLSRIYISEFTEGKLSTTEIAEQFADDPAEVRQVLENHLLSVVRDNQTSWWFRRGWKVGVLSGILVFILANWGVSFITPDDPAKIVPGRVIFGLLSLFLFVFLPSIFCCLEADVGDHHIKKSKEKLGSVGEDELRLIVEDLEDRPANRRWLEVDYKRQAGYYKEVPPKAYVNEHGPKAIHDRATCTLCVAHALRLSRNMPGPKPALLADQVMTIYGKPVSKEIVRGAIETMDDWYPARVYGNVGFSKVYSTSSTGPK